MARAAAPRTTPLLHPDEKWIPFAGIPFPPPRALSALCRQTCPSAAFGTRPLGQARRRRSNSAAVDERGPARSPVMISGALLGLSAELWLTARVRGI